jgi:hypothetical protein
MAEPELTDTLAATEILSPTVREIIHHLCGGGGRSEACRAYGVVVEWCEGRGDCCYAVVCPGCSLQFLVDEEELAELRRWTDAEGNALVCGVQWE